MIIVFYNMAFQHFIWFTLQTFANSDMDSMKKQNERPLYGVVSFPS